MEFYDRHIFYIGLKTNENESITNAEYFFDIDPGLGSGTSISINENTGRLTQSISIATEGLSNGVHTFYIRIQTASGAWSLYDSANFTIDPTAIDNTVTVNENVLTANFSSPGTTYQWLDCNNGATIIPNETGRNFTAGFSGTYAVQIMLNGQTVISNCIIIEVANPSDMDNDGIPDNLDLCPNTPQNAFVDFNGCEIFSLSNSNFTLKTQGESCRNNNDGQIQISTNKMLPYRAILNGVVQGTFDFTDSLIIPNLPSGDYQVCITVDGQPGYEQCFEVSISEPESLSASAKVNFVEKSVTLDLRGSKQYTIIINDKVHRTPESSITLPLDKIENTIAVYGEKGCQGTYEEMVVMTDLLFAYPNPIVTESLSVYLGSVNEFQKVNGKIYDMTGSKVIEKVFEVANGYIEVDFEMLSKGTYILSIENKTILFNQKIIKQ